MSAKLDTFDGNRFARELLDAARKAIHETAKQVPIDQARRISMRLTPSGEAQKANTPKVAKAKMKRLGHSIPLRDQGVLATPSKYTIKKQGPSNYKISLPASRVQVLQYLRRLDYKYWEISPQIVEFLSNALKVAVNHMRKNSQAYSKEG